MNKWKGVRTTRLFNDREGVYVAKTTSGKKIYTYAKSQESAFNSCLNGVSYNDDILHVTIEKDI